MTTQTGPLHELAFSVAQERIEEFERWLAELAEGSLHQQGLADARVFTVGDDAGDGATFICQFQCTDDSAFNDLLDGFFADTEAAAAQEFGTAVKVSSRTLREDAVQNLPATDGSPDCLNCGSRLTGQYCG